jgi:hypothetical protein
MTAVDLESRLSLAEDEPAVRSLANESGAELVADETETGTYWLVMHPRTAPEETFIARIDWTRYPYDPPSVRFADSVGGSIDRTGAWPVIPGYRPGAFDICQPFTAEGFTVHPEWVSGPEAWRPTGNPFLWVVGTLLHDMADRYQGRSA